jgi:hypothetical protein
MEKVVDYVDIMSKAWKNIRIKLRIHWDVLFEGIYQQHPYQMGGIRSKF